MTTVDPDAYRNWTPAAQARALAALQAQRDDNWRPFYCGDRTCNGLPHDEWTWNHARSDQYPPTDLDYLTWAITSGRGAGKTRTGAELTHQMTEVTGRIAIVGATGADVRDTMLEGESGIISIARPDRRPKYEPSKRRLTWPNGCVATTFSGEEPDRLRGPEHGYGWLDEPAHWALIQECWDNLLFGLRIGRKPRVLITTTPKPRPWLKALLKDPRTIHTVTSTYANLDNLAPTYADTVISRYEGTRLGRQELHGELLEDVEGALWTYDMIEPDRVPQAPPMQRVVIGVDPAGGATKSNDETGIIVCGVAAGHLYVLADRSGRFSPYGWAQAVDAAFEEFGADAVVAETNYGGEMVTANLRNAGFPKRVIGVNSRRGKAIRAEPIVGIYEQHKVHHVGIFTELEDQLTSWQPYEDRDSPDRLDALVHAATNLVGKSQLATVATPSQLRKRDDAVALARARHHLNGVRR